MSRIFTISLNFIEWLGGTLRKVVIGFVILIFLATIFLGVLDLSYGVDFTKSSTNESHQKIINFHEMILLGSNKKDVIRIADNANKTRVHLFQEKIVINTPFSLYSPIWSLVVSFCGDVVSKVEIRENDDGTKPEKTPNDKVMVCDLEKNKR